MTLTLALGLAGALLGWAAQPPLGWGWLAWIAPAPWCALAALPTLDARRPYRTLWLCGCLHWLLTIQWLRLPHAANYGAWLFVSIYLGCYLPTFVAAGRTLVLRGRWPLWLAAPVAWTGLEWLRAHLLTGFFMASLAHTQTASPVVLQIADLCGEYGVTFVMVLVAAAVAQAAFARGGKALGGHALPPVEREPPRARFLAQRILLAALPAIVAVAATYAYGRHRLDELSPEDGAPTARVALVQPDMPAGWKGSEELDRQVMQQQLELTADARRKSPRPLDLVIWPETMFRTPMFVRDPDRPPPADNDIPAPNYDVAVRDLAAVANVANSAVLVGLDRVLVSRASAGDDSRPYGLQGRNSAAGVDRTGRLLGTYDKMHLLPFGEYVPLVDWLPLLRRITPVTGIAAPGDAATLLVIDLDAAKPAGEPAPSHEESPRRRVLAVAPNICYETVLPHLMRRQWRQLVDGGRREPDLLANLTNDAWYWGSAELDMHLACGVLRAIEFRTPLAIAANRGLSAYVTRSGEIRGVTQRNTADHLLCDVPLSPRPRAAETFYARHGDWLPLACLVCCTVYAVVARRRAGDA